MAIRLTAIGLLMCALLCACTSAAPPDLKSPCTGIAGSPCERRPVNDWWMQG
ncbi:MAG: hypothetical protein JO089_09675 [Alphaproteobacteria bacterium]|nr:hypothetical protein [Alphaproteobacteria bacterium]